MRNSLIFALATIALMMGAMSSTPAATTHALSGTWSMGSIKSHCNAAGGTMGYQADGGYSCNAPGGAVDCKKNGKCTGTNPTHLGGGNKTGPVTGGGFKQQGNPAINNGLTPVPVGGSKQTGGSNQPVTIERNNTQPSGGGGGGGKK